MTPAQRTACEAALEAAERAAEALRAVLEAAPAADPSELVPLGRACRAWGISKAAGLKRARRGIGQKIAGRWFVPRAALHSAT